MVHTQRRGAESALMSLCKHFKDGLFEALPDLWTHITEPLETPPTPPYNKSQETTPTDHFKIYIFSLVDPSAEAVAKAQSLIDSIQILEIISPSLAPPLHPRVLSLLPRLLCTLHSHFTAVRHMSARAIASLTRVDLHRTMEVQCMEPL